MQNAITKIKKVCKDSEKFDKKIVGKQFLLGKYFESQTKLNRRKDKKYEQSKRQKLLKNQQNFSKQSINGYETFLPLHNLWKSYIASLIFQEKNEETLNIKLLRSDFHGSIIKVVHSKIDSYIGLQGIVIQQSLKTFKIMTNQNKILTLLKNEIVFLLQACNKFFVLNGNFLIFRPGDRLKHKYKNRRCEPMNREFINILSKYEPQNQMDVQ